MCLINVSGAWLPPIYNLHNIINVMDQCDILHGPYNAVMMTQGWRVD